MQAEGVCSEGEMGAKSSLRPLGPHTFTGAPLAVLANIHCQTALATSACRAAGTPHCTCAPVTFPWVLMPRAVQTAVTFPRPHLDGWS